MLTTQYYLALKAEALQLADHTPEAVEVITEAEALVAGTGERWWCAELHRLRGVFLAAVGADEGNPGLILRSYEVLKGAEIGFARETGRSDLCGILPPKSRCFRRTWDITACSTLSLGFVVGSPALSNKRLRCKARTLRLHEIR
jgi:hypothetical protein